MLKQGEKKFIKHTPSNPVITTVLSSLKFKEAFLTTNVWALIY